ncbi:MAG: hypothetical protein H5T83_07285 [Actinotalea sp.]|nr:hypothetical protein [Actinotalea sp.]
MRSRLTWAFVGLTVLALVLYGLPRAFLLADLVRAAEERTATEVATLVAVVLEEREARGDAVTEASLQELLGEGEAARYVRADGTEVTAGSAPGEGGITVTRDVGPGGTLTLAHSGDAVQAAVVAALTPLVLMGLLLVPAAVVAARLLARRLTRPFDELARAAADLGTGRFDIAVPRTTIPEADAIGRALVGSAERLEELLDREREFAVHASHRLRTPITALRLDLEDLSLWPETPPTVAAQLTASLGELDRLAAAVTELLDDARGRRVAATVPVDLTAFVRRVVDRRQGEGLCPERDVVVEGGTGVVARVDPALLRQILEVLLDNACRHGAGRVTVRTADRGNRVELCVADEGAGLAEGIAFPSRSATEGVGGLVGARDRAEALGGRLALEPGDGTTLVLTLPKP